MSDPGGDPRAFAYLARPLGSWVNADGTDSEVWSLAAVDVGQQSCTLALFAGIRIGELERALDAAQGHERDIADRFYRAGREAGFREGYEIDRCWTTGLRR